MQQAVAVAIPTGTTTAQTSASVPLPSGVAQLAAQLVVEVAGATPTITWKAQVSVDNINWYDLTYFTDASDTLSAATRTATGVGGQVNYADTGNGSRFWAFVRFVTSADTNVTYRAEVYYKYGAAS